MEEYSNLCCFFCYCKDYFLFWCLFRLCKSFIFYHSNKQGEPVKIDILSLKGFITSGQDSLLYLLAPGCKCPSFKSTIQCPSKRQRQECSNNYMKLTMILCEYTQIVIQSKIHFSVNLISQFKAFFPVVTSFDIF